MAKECTNLEEAGLEIDWKIAPVSCQQFSWFDQGCPAEVLLGYKFEQRGIVFAFLGFLYFFLLLGWWVDGPT